jgi:hypothetical protein
MLLAPCCAVQFKELKIIAYYLDVRKQLRALREQGVVALARVEREMLLKVRVWRVACSHVYVFVFGTRATQARTRARC